MAERDFVKANLSQSNDELVDLDDVVIDPSGAVFLEDVQVAPGCSYGKARGKRGSRQSSRSTGARS